MVKYRDVIDVAEEDSENEAEEAQEEFEERHGGGSDLGEVREDDMPTEYGCLEETQECQPQEWHQNASYTSSVRNRPYSPSQSVRSHDSRFSALSYNSTGSNASTSSILSAGRYVKNFFVRILSSMKGSSKNLVSNNMEGEDCSGSDRLGYPTFSHGRLSSRPVSPMNTSVMDRSRPRQARSESPQHYRNMPPRSQSPAPQSQRNLFRSLSPASYRIHACDQPTDGDGIQRQDVRTRSVSPSQCSTRSHESGTGPDNSKDQTGLPHAHPPLNSVRSWASMGSSQRSVGSVSSGRRTLPLPPPASFSASERNLMPAQGFQRNPAFSSSQQSLTPSTNDRDASRSRSPVDRLGGSLRNLFSTKPPPKRRVDPKQNRKFCNKAAHPRRQLLDPQGFDEIDSDKSGSVSFDEFRRSKFGAALSAEDARRAFDRIDSDKSGTIEACEWRAWTKFKAERALRKKLVTGEMLVEELCGS